MGEAIAIINLVIPGVAVCLVFVLQILTEIRNRTFNATTATDAATRLAMYASAIAALEILSAFEAGISHYVTPTATAFGFAELYRAARLLANATGDRVIKKALDEAQKDGGDPFGAARK